MKTIVVDLMGADNPIASLLPGAIKAVNENKDIKVVLCGNEEEIREALVKENYNSAQVEILPSGEAITNEDNPTRAFRTKVDSSLVLGLNRAKEADGFVSCGSTGAVLVSATFILGRINSVRPALCACLKNVVNKDFLVVDCGANIDCKVDQLLDFAHMGEAYMEARGFELPRIGLLSNGAEEKKGNALTKETHELFKTQSFNFVGNIEGKDVMSDKADVIVTDGFAGNVVLKTIEGAAKTVFTDMIKMAKKSNDENVSATLMKAVKTLLDKYDYNSKGGSVLLGVNSVVVKGHGAANSETIYSIINQCYDLASHDLINKIKAKLN